MRLKQTYCTFILLYTGARRARYRKMPGQSRKQYHRVMAFVSSSFRNRDIIHDFVLNYIRIGSRHNANYNNCAVHFILEVGTSSFMYSDISVDFSARSYIKNNKILITIRTRNKHLKCINALRGRVHFSCHV